MNSAESISSIAKAIERDEIHRLEREIHKLQLLVESARHLLMNAKVKVPGGPTDWEETKERWISHAKTTFALQDEAEMEKMRKEIDRLKKELQASNDKLDQHIAGEDW